MNAIMLARRNKETPGRCLYRAAVSYRRDVFTRYTYESSTKHMSLNTIQSLLAASEAMLHACAMMRREVRELHSGSAPTYEEIMSKVVEVSTLPPVPRGLPDSHPWSDVCWIGRDCMSGFVEHNRAVRYRYSDGAWLEIGGHKRANFVPTHWRLVEPRS